MITKQQHFVLLRPWNGGWIRGIMEAELGLIDQDINDTALRPFQKDWRNKDGAPESAIYKSNILWTLDHQNLPVELWIGLYNGFLFTWNRETDFCTRVFCLIRLGRKRMNRMWFLWLWENVGGKEGKGNSVLRILRGESCDLFVIRAWLKD